MERIGTARIKTWLPENKPLLEKLLGTIEHPQVTRKYIPEMLNAVQLLIAFGPPEFGQVARSHVASWVRALPPEAPDPAGHSGPFAGYHITNAGLDEAREQLGWIVFQYVQREGIAANDLVDGFVESTRRFQWKDPIGILCRSLIVLASKMAPEAGKQKIQAVRQLIDVLRAQMEANQEVAYHIASVLSFFVGLFGPMRSRLIDWESANGRATLNELVSVLEAILPSLAASPNVQVRINVARALANLSSWKQLPDSLIAVIFKLAEDNRARVRRASQVGLSD